MSGSRIEEPQQRMLASVQILIDADVVASRRTARSLSERLALTPAQRLALAAAVGELGRIALHEGGGGEAVFEDVQHDGLRGLRVTLKGQSQGPEALRRSLRDSTTPGLAAIQRAVDALSIEPGADGGSVVRVVKWEDLEQRRLRERVRDLI